MRAGRSSGPTPDRSPSRPPSARARGVDRRDQLTSPGVEVDETLDVHAVVAAPGERRHGRVEVLTEQAWIDHVRQASGAH
jgi:hypothetical protein